jgi:hypothetical protein
MADTAAVDVAAAVRAAIAVIIAGRATRRVNAVNPVPAPLIKAARIAASRGAKAISADSAADVDAAAADAIAAKAAVITVVRVRKASKAAERFDQSVN